MKIRVSCILLASLAACGGDDESSTPTTADTASASASISGMSTFAASIQGANGADAAFAAFQIGAAAQAIVIPATDGQSTAALRVPPSPAVTGTCTCDPSGCTFEACGDDGGLWTIDGAIDVDGDHYTFDLQLAVGTNGLAFDWSYEGDLTITPALIDGTASGDGGGSLEDDEGHSFDFSWSWDVDWNEIVLDAASCATGGSLDASVSYDVSGSGARGSFSGSASVAFGPACGDVVAE